jgi:hypothetical protein
MSDLQQPSDLSSVPEVNGSVPLDAAAFVTRVFERNDALVLADTNHRNDAIGATTASLIANARPNQPLLIFTETSRDNQPIIDKYMRTGNPDDLAYFGGEESGGATLSNRVSLYTESRAAGARVYAMDVTKERMAAAEFDTEAIQNASLYRSKYGQEKFDRDYETEYMAFKKWRASHNDSMVEFIKQKRDEFMRDNPGTNPKVLVLVGAAHVSNTTSTDPDMDELIASQLGVNTVTVSMKPALGGALNPYITTGGTLKGYDKPEFTMNLPTNDTIKMRETFKHLVEESYRRADAVLEGNGSTKTPDREALAESMLAVQAGIATGLQDLQIYLTPPDQLPPKLREELRQRLESNPKKTQAAIEAAKQLEADFKAVQAEFDKEPPDYSKMRAGLEKLNEKIGRINGNSPNPVLPDMETALSAANVIVSTEINRAREFLEAQPAIRQQFTDGMRERMADAAAELAQAKRNETKDPNAFQQAWAKFNEQYEAALASMPATDDMARPQIRGILSRETRNVIAREALEAGSIPAKYRIEDIGESPGIDRAQVLKIFTRLQDQDQARTMGMIDPKRLAAAVQAIARLDIGRDSDREGVPSQPDRVVSQREIARLTDRNSDGVEYSPEVRQENARRKKELLEKLDLNGDGAITRDELKMVALAVKTAGITLDTASLGLVIKDNIVPLPGDAMPQGRGKGR